MKKTNLEICRESLEAEVKNLQGRPCSKDTLNELNDFLEWLNIFVNTDRGREFNEIPFTRKAWAHHEILKSLKAQALKDGVFLGANL